MKKGRMLGLVADQDGGYHGIFVPFLGKMASTPTGPAYFARKFKAPVVPMFIVRKEGLLRPSGHRGRSLSLTMKIPAISKPMTIDMTLKMTQAVEDYHQEVSGQLVMVPASLEYTVYPAGRGGSHP
jgi:KDO2-lipid IV(A) lauroyltransferase